LASGAITIEEIRAFSKIREKENAEDEDNSETIASLKSILAIADKVEEDLLKMKAEMVVA
jgi:hypothetical protein